MPELPEVETIKRGLNSVLKGQEIISVDVRVPKLFTGSTAQITGQKIVELERRAKLLIWRLEKNYLITHLKMTGQLIYVPNDSKSYVVGGHPDKAYSLDLPHKHTHIIFELTNGKIYYNDLRKFGWIKVIDSPEQIRDIVAEYGPEYDWPEFSFDYFYSRLQKHPTWTIRQALIDQTIIAGLGVIYADESLFRTGIRPRRKISELSKKDIEKIYHEIPRVLELSLKHGGTSSKDYRRSDGSMGTYLNVANVYKREGLPCKVCGTPIERIKIAGRSAHFCPKCQN